MPENNTAPQSETSQAPPVLVERDGHVLVLTINRPHVRNAVNQAVGTTIGYALEEAANDPQVRAVVLTGAGDKAFCAGADLAALSRGEDFYVEGHASWGFGGYVGHFIDKPTIAAVNGLAFGGGAELVLASDLVVAVESAKIGLPEVTRGLIAGAGGAFRLPEQIPRRVAMRLLLTGEPITAAEAQRWGLINEVVPDGKALEAALTLAHTIAANAPLAVWATKRLAYGVRDGRPENERDQWKHNLDEVAALLRTEDAAEGPRAFTEKRAPRWKAR
ncbi:MAG TPA: crotonase/enoyl-CoA hydratase family protein [Nocardia sp.]|uniref:crotonase/enoyl-CoA hydratase family protein n=1 Tax=Nocardia sp. TaxID=1821 RepID=UPI002B4B50D1|nr:crotonase/enoyl-CoA hydratase family protein [Nocardia sp.]HLS77443.1 crotonase/enoyl-CoA hydratase family protein [Nocardia sp.]